tara:strand:+ start:381 stop:740 length:360 start_codon:yes stop_codon:yes gene_type:complete
MTHEYYIQSTTRDRSTGLISKIKFVLKTSLTIDGKTLTYTRKYDCVTPGSISDSGFIPFDSLTPSNILELINKNGSDDDPTTGLSTYQTANSASFADAHRLSPTLDDLPPNVNSGSITV